MAIFNSYVSLPEGMQRNVILWLWHNIYVSGGKLDWRSNIANQIGL